MSPSLAALSEVILRTASSSRSSCAIRERIRPGRAGRCRSCAGADCRAAAVLRSTSRAVGADRAPRLDQGQVHVFFGVMGVDRATEPPSSISKSKSTSSGSGAGSVPCRSPR